MAAAQPRPRRAGVPPDVGQRLGRGEVQRRLDRGLRPRGQVDVDRDGDGAQQGGGLQSSSEATVGENRRVDAADEVAQLGERGAGIGARLLQQRGRAVGVGVGADGLRRQPERHPDGGEPRLCAVVQVTLDAPQLGGLRVDRGGSGHRELLDAPGQRGVGRGEKRAYQQREPADRPWHGPPDDRREDQHRQRQDRERTLAPTRRLDRAASSP
jgi:hypothetical protein